MNPELKDDPQTIVDRLNGIYPSAVDTYPVSPIQKEAAREIMRLREKLASTKELTEQVIEMCESEYGSLWETGELRKLLGLDPYLSR